MGQFLPMPVEQVERNGGTVMMRNSCQYVECMPMSLTPNGPMLIMEAVRTCAPGTGLYLDFEGGMENPCKPRNNCLPYMGNGKYLGH